MGLFDVHTGFISTRSVGASIVGLDRSVKKIAKNLLEVTKNSQSYAANEIVKKLKQNIDLGRVPLVGVFQKNAPRTIDRKGSNKPLFEFGDLKKSIVAKPGLSTRNKKDILIGIPSGSTNRKGDDLQIIMKILENGTRDGRIPSRPLFEWTALGLFKEKKFTENFINAVNKDLRKLFEENDAI